MKVYFIKSTNIENNYCIIIDILLFYYNIFYLFNFNVTYLYKVI